jgi:RNA polymerase sigma-70 factor (ECF subfamily)
MQIATSICYERSRQRRSKRRTGSSHGDTFQAYLSALPLDQRVAVVLSDIEGLTYHEIAQVLGIPGGIVRSRLSQGRAALHDSLLSKGKIGP